MYSDDDSFATRQRIEQEKQKKHVPEGGEKAWQGRGTTCPGKAS